MLKRFSTISCFFMLIIGVFACKNNAQPSIKLSTEKINQKTYRFDELLTQNNTITEKDIDIVKENHSEFFTAFNQTILNAKPNQTVKDINQYKNYFDTIGVNEKIRRQYQNIKHLQQEFNNVQQRLLTAKPNYKPVELITINSGFNYKNFLIDNAVVVGLDMYLNDIGYEQISSNFPAYKAHTFNKEYILPDITQSLLVDFYPDQAEQNSLLDKMLYQGKLLEYKQQLLPNVKPNIIIGMTEKDYQWCKDNERDIYRFLVSENLLYSINFGEFKTYIGEGPYSAGMPEGAPANTGSYIGWKIIQNYISKNKKPIYEVMSNNNSQEILNTAKYKP